MELLFEFLPATGVGYPRGSRWINKLNKVLLRMQDEGGRDLHHWHLPCYFPYLLHSHSLPPPPTPPATGLGYPRRSRWIKKFNKVLLRMQDEGERDWHHCHPPCYFPYLLHSHSPPPPPLTPPATGLGYPRGSRWIEKLNKVLLRMQVRGLCTTVTSALATSFFPAPPPPPPLPLRPV